MNAEQWIQAFAAELGVDPPSEETTSELLELAGTAAHSSERVAAPIACYLAGVTGRPLDELRAIADKIGN